jgi:hypothetical protein
MSVTNKLKVESKMLRTKQQYKYFSMMSEVGLSVISCMGAVS